MAEPRLSSECDEFHIFKDLLLYEPETGKLYWKVTLNSRAIAGLEAGCLVNGYIQIQIDGVSYQAHRIAHLLMTGHWPEGDPDHENRIRHDNRWENIKDIATKHENAGNRGISRVNTSGFKGVRWHKGKWIAQIKVFGRSVYLGSFYDPRSAGLHYDAAAKLVWGLRFSCLNFPFEESDKIVLSDRVLRQLGET